MKILKAVLLMGLILFTGLSTVYAGTAGDPGAATQAIPQKQLDAYVAVSRLISRNPAMNREDIELLLKKHGLSTEEYDSIDQQVQADPDLKARVEEELNKEEQVQKKIQESPDVRTKLKQPSPETPEE